MPMQLGGMYSECLCSDKVYSNLPYLHADTISRFPRFSSCTFPLVNFDINR